ncbi:hypothetical protein AVEN_57838-1 [Araneus ventricosus]|uniref:Uncharacterized protein n=1 Tax=Araneus ventricosus TaxID=182803 RepID=A0A4Y2PG94_ARAVE|nr:hypothetical protein AVEN_57838-1 [Araneus ventricosus]
MLKFAQACVCKQQAACRRATKSICVVTTSRTWGSSSMAVTFARSYTVGFFPMGPSQGAGVLRRSDNTNGLSCSSACCLYFGGPRDAATCDESHSTACASLPRHARRTL